jgi:ribosome production factor 1
VFEADQGVSQPFAVPTACCITVRFPQRMYEFIQDLLLVFPNSFYYARKKYDVSNARECNLWLISLEQLQKIVGYASEKGFTDILVINEDRKKLSMQRRSVLTACSVLLCVLVDGLTHIHLPDGPTAYYKLSNVQLASEIPV